MGNDVTGGFPGTQNYLNTGIGTSNYVNQGGLLTQGVPGYQNNPAPAGGANAVLQRDMNQANSILSPETNPQFGAANPYLRDYANAAMLPTIQNYENAVAPNLLANFAGSGTVGGTGQQQAFQNAESSLAQGLGTESASIYEPAWSQQSAQQAQALGQQSAQAAAAAQQASGQRYGGFENLLNMTGQSIAGSPSLAQGAYIPAQELFGSGGMGQNQLQNILNSAYGNLYQQGQWPFTELNMLGAGLGNYPQGSGTSSTTMTGQGSMK